MAYEEKSRKESHHLILEGREKLTLSGVEDVDRFDESVIVMYTEKGALTVRGQGLHIDRLSIEGGEVNVEGYIDSLQYADEAGPHRSWLSKLLG